MGGIILLSGNINNAIIPISAAIIHELGHILFAILYSVKIEKLELNLFGALIRIPPLSCSYKQEAMLSAAGPLANIIFGTACALLLPYAKAELCESILYFVISSYVFAFINLLPAKDFDGGRILGCCLLNRFSPDFVHTILEWASLLCVFLLWSVSVYFILRTGSYLSLFVFSGALFARIFTFEARSRD
jgi:Zn-dependent protease